MKFLIIPAAFSVMMLSSAGAQAQTAKAKPQENAQGAAGAAAMNMKDIEGKWKIDHVDVDIKTPEGEQMKNTEPGGDEDFFELQKGTMSSYIQGNSETVPYTLAGGYIITRSNGIVDSFKIMSLTKANCVLYKKEESAEGTGSITITLKR